MKKALYPLLLALFLLLSACESQRYAEPSPSSNPPEADISTPAEDAVWTRQELQELFSRHQEEHWEYLDCVTMPDRSCNRIGAVLFLDSQKENTCIAFFTETGSYQLCGAYAKAPEKPQLTYLGDGTVSFLLEAEDGTTSTYTLTISQSGSDVNFQLESQ